MTKLIISFAGHKGSGKNTAADLLKDKFGDKLVNTIAIAKPLKLACQDAFSFPLDIFEDQVRKELPYKHVVPTLKQLELFLSHFNSGSGSVGLSKEACELVLKMDITTPRELLQQMGMLARIVHGQDIHVETAIPMDRLADVTLVTDLRFVNEYDYLNKGNDFEDSGYLMYPKPPIHIPLFVYNEQAIANTDNHISEQDYKNFMDKCYRVDNNTKSLVELEKGLIRVLRVAYKDKGLVCEF